MKMKKYTLNFTNETKANEFYTLFGGKENKQVKLDKNSMTAKLAYNPLNVYDNDTMVRYGIEEIK